MISWNEEDSIPLALRSIQDFADEIIVLDNGSFDNTVKVAKETIAELDLSGEVKVKSGCLMYESRYQCIKMCTGDWIMMQDANLVMRNNGKHSTKTLRKLAEQWKNVIFRCADINLYGDYQHVMRNRPINVPHKLFFHNTGKIKPAIPPARDRPLFLNLKPITLDGVWGANMSTVRPAWRVWYRMRQSDWIIDRRFGSIPEYVENTKGKSIEEVKKLAPQWYLERCRNQCIKIDDYFNEGLAILPQVLRDEISNGPYYRIMYDDNGEIIGRLPDVPP